MTPTTRPIAKSAFIWQPTCLPSSPSAAFPPVSGRIVGAEYFPRGECALATGLMACELGAGERKTDHHCSECGAAVGYNPTRGELIMRQLQYPASGANLVGVMLASLQVRCQGRVAIRYTPVDSG